VNATSTATPPLGTSVNPAPVTPFDHDLGPEPHDEHALKRTDLVRIGLVALTGLASWSGVWRPVVRFDAIALVATLAGGYPIFREAFANLLARRMTMELSMTIALAAALAIGEFLHRRGDRAVRPRGEGPRRTDRGARAPGHQRPQREHRPRDARILEGVRLHVALRSDETATASRRFREYAPSPRRRAQRHRSRAAAAIPLRCPSPRLCPTVSRALCRLPSARERGMGSFRSS
jgi:hypothetical protein